MRSLVLALGAALLVAVLPSFATAGDPAPSPAAVAKPVVLANATCPVTGEPAGDDVTTVWEGLEVRFCCPGCIPTFKAEPAKYAPGLLRDLAAQLATARAAADAKAVPAAPGATAAPAPKPASATGEGSCAGKCAGKAEGSCAGKGEGECPGKCADKGEGGCAGKCGSDCPCAGDGACKGECPSKGAGAEAPQGAAGADAGKPAGTDGAPTAAAAEVVDLANPTCPVMAGRPSRASVTGTWRNVKVRYCCAGCDAKFQKDPEAYLAKMAADDAGVARRVESARAAWAAAHPAK